MIRLAGVPMMILVILLALVALFVHFRDRDKGKILLLDHAAIFAQYGNVLPAGSKNGV